MNIFCTSNFFGLSIIYTLLTRNSRSSTVIAGSIGAHIVPHAQLPSAVHPPAQCNRGGQSLVPSPNSPAVPSSPVVPPASQSLVSGRRLQRDSQLDERTRTSASPPRHVAGAAPSTATPVVSAKSIGSSGLQVRSIRFSMVGTSCLLSSRSTVCRFYYDVVRNVSVQDHNWLHICLPVVARDPVLLLLVEVLRSRSFGRHSLGLPKNGSMSSWT